MLKIKKNLLLGTMIVSSLFSTDSIGMEKERRKGEAKPIVRFFVNNSKKESPCKREEKKPTMGKVPVLSEPQTLKSTAALRKLLWRAWDLSNRDKQLVKLGELTLDIPKECREEAAAQCANNDHISALAIPSYLIVRNFIQELNGIKTTVRRDLEKDSITDIHEWLNRIAKLSKSRGASTAYNVLSIHNATQEQADEILNASTITHLGGVRIWLRPEPSEAEVPTPNEGENKENAQTIEERDGHSLKSGSKAFAEPFAVAIKEKTDEKAVVTKEGDADAANHSVSSLTKELSPKREEKKPAMKKAPAWSEPQTLKSTADLRKLLWEAKTLSNREKQLIKLGELTLDIPTEHREEAAAQCANNDHISTLEIPSYLIVRNFIQELDWIKTTVRRDLEKDSIADIHRWLNHIAELSKSRGADTAYNVLSIRNATQEQADEILKASTITHLGGIRIWLRSAPELPTPNEEDNKETPQTIEEHSVKGESEASPLADAPLDDIDHHRWDLLSWLRPFGLREPISKPLDFLSQAPEYSDADPMTVAVDLPNATQGQSDEIRDDKNADIEASHPDPDLVPVELRLELRNEGEKEGTTEITEKDDTERLARDLHQGHFKPTLREIANRKGAFHRRLLSQPHLFDLSVVSVHMILDLLRKAHKYSQEDTPIQVPLSLHNITKRQLDDILTDENADYIKSLKWEYREGEENIQGENIDVLDEPLHQQFDGQFFKKGDLPVLEELAQNLEEQALFEPKEEQDKEVSQEYEGEPILLNWEMTSLTKGIDLDDLGFEADREAKKPQDPVLPQVQHASQNLVQLYCRPYLRR